jgi:iron complex transport system permease protein
MKLTHSTIKFFILLVLLVVVCIAALLLGSKSISLVSLFESAESPTGRVLWQHRMPHVLGAIVVGSSLALSGNYMQVIFRNPLAGPSVLGITGGASLAMAVIFLTSWGMIYSGVCGRYAGALAFARYSTKNTDGFYAVGCWTSLFPFYGSH